MAKSNVGSDFDAFLKQEGLLDPENSPVTLQTLQSAVQALGGRLKVELVFDKRVTWVAQLCDVAFGDQSKRGATLDG